MPTATPSIACSGLATPSRLEQNRSRLLALFVEHGYGQVSLRTVAAELQLTVGTLYHHCSGKEDLLFELLEEHYIALLSLFYSHKKNAGGMRSVPGVLEALLRLHKHNPLYFQLASRERHCLRGSHRLRIDDLRNQIQSSLIELLSSTWKVPTEQILGGPALSVFE